MQPFRNTRDTRAGHACSVNLERSSRHEQVEPRPGVHRPARLVRACGRRGPVQAGDPRRQARAARRTVRIEHCRGHADGRRPARGIHRQPAHWNHARQALSGARRVAENDRSALRRRALRIAGDLRPGAAARQPRRQVIRGAAGIVRRLRRVRRGPRHRNGARAREIRRRPGCVAGGRAAQRGRKRSLVRARARRGARHAQARGTLGRAGEPLAADCQYHMKASAIDSSPSGPAVLATAHILAIDDDPAMRELVANYLSGNDLRVTAVATGAEMAQALAEHAIDLVVLDLRLAGEDGMELARKLREQGATPIIMLTGRQDEADRVMGLELGADDYLTKPFSPRELLARIRALLRRARSGQTVADGLQKVRAYRFAGWELNVRLRRLAAPDGVPVPLTSSQFNLLAVFLASPQHVLSREQLLGLSRLHNDEVYDRSIDVQVARLRRKMQPGEGAAEIIRTERGAGYVFTASVEIVR